MGAVQAVSKLNSQVAQGVFTMKHKISDMAEFAGVHQALRLVTEEPNRIAAYTTEVDIIEKQKGIYYFAKRMAKTVIPPVEIKEIDENRY